MVNIHYNQWSHVVAFYETLTLACKYIYEKKRNKNRRQKRSLMKWLSAKQVSLTITIFICLVVPVINYLKSANNIHNNNVELIISAVLTRGAILNYLSLWNRVYFNTAETWKLIKKLINILGYLKDNCLLQFLTAYHKHVIFNCRWNNWNWVKFMHLVEYYKIWSLVNTEEVY